MKLTHARLLELLDYDRESGLFRWKVSRQSHGGILQPGEIAGHLEQSVGYIVIGIDGEHCRAHRLAWFYCFGEWPKGVIDHINSNKTDNRIANLRDVSQSINNLNRVGPQRNNKLRVLGVTERKGRFLAQIVVNGRRVFHCWYGTVDEAAAARNLAKRSLVSSMRSA